MQDRFDRIETELRQVADQLRRLESRVSRIEERGSEGASLKETESPEPVPRETVSAPTVAAASLSTAHVLGLFGRTFLILCGAFLLRSLTDAEILPLSLGVTLGIAYAAAWIVAADRAAHSKRALSAILFGLASTVVAYPLIWEATSRFSLLQASASAAILAVFSALALLVAWRHNIEVLAWFVTAAALITDLVIMLAHRNWGSGATVSLLLGGATVWFAYTRGWLVLRWPVAVAVNMVPLILISTSVSAAKPGVPEGPEVSLVYLVLSAYLAVYLGSFAVRALKQGLNLGAFEYAQTIAGLVIGLAGAVTVTQAAGINTGLLGWPALAVGVTCYGVSFAFVDRRLGLGRTFYYYTSIGLCLVTWGLVVMAGDLATVTALCGLGMTAAVLGRRFNRITLRSHSAAYLTIAAAVGGIGARATQSLVVPVSEPPSGVAGEVVLVTATAVACYLVIVDKRTAEGVAWPRRIPAFVLAVVSLVGAASLWLLVAFDLLGRTAGIDPATVAALRTATLSLSAIILAGLGSRRSLVELTWLVYPLLVITGAKVLVEDLRQGRPLMLAVSFAAFGVALMFAPRLLRSSKRPTIAGESTV